MIKTKVGISILGKVTNLVMWRKKFVKAAFNSGGELPVANSPLFFRAFLLRLEPSDSPEKRGYLLKN